MYFLPNVVAGSPQALSRLCCSQVVPKMSGAWLDHALASKNSATAMKIEPRGIREIVADLSKTVALATSKLAAGGLFQSGRSETS